MNLRGCGRCGVGTGICFARASFGCEWITEIWGLYKLLFILCPSAVLPVGVGGDSIGMRIRSIQDGRSNVKQAKVVVAVYSRKSCLLL